MYAANVGTFLQRDPQSTSGIDLLYDHDYVTGMISPHNFEQGTLDNDGSSLYEYTGSNPIGRVDPEGLDWLDCMNACIQDNDPIGLALEALIGLLAIGPVHKLTVAAIAKALGDAEFAKTMERAYRLNPKSPLTTWPSSLTTKLKTAGKLGRGSRVLRSAGRIATPIFVAYGNALAAVEVHCAGYCGGCWWYGVPDYDPDTGRITDSLGSYFNR